MKIVVLCIIIKETIKYNLFFSRFLKHKNYYIKFLALLKLLDAQTNLFKNAKYILNGQVDILLRALELYGYNLEFMLDITDSSNENKEEKLALLKFTYEQILATQAEQVNGKKDNLDNLSNLGKMFSKNLNSLDSNKKLNVI